MSRKNGPEALILRPSMSSHMVLAEVQETDLQAAFPGVSYSELI